MKFLISMLALAVLSVSCGKNSDSEKQISNSAIIGGTRVEFSADDSIAAATVRFDSTSGKICTGVVISKRAILTAAHCMVNETVKSYYKVIWAGDSNIDKAISKIIIHKDFDPKTLKNDLAIVKLVYDISPTIKPVKIFESPKSLQEGTPLTVAGYSSLLKNQKRDIFDVFSRTIPLDYVSNQFNQLYRQGVIYSETKDNMVSFNQVWGGVCSGDSGGPTFVMAGDKPTKEAQGYLLAINSSVTGNTIGDKVYSDCELYGNSTLVAPYRQWIEKQISKNDWPTFEDATDLIPAANIQCGKAVSKAIEKYFKVFNTNTCLDKQEALNTMDDATEECVRECENNKSDINRCLWLRKGEEKIAAKVSKQCK